MIFSPWMLQCTERLFFFQPALGPLQEVPAQYDFWDLKKIVLCEIRTSWDYIVNFHQYEFYYIGNARNSTSTNFIPIALKIVLVEFVLVETVLVGDPLYFTFFGLKPPTTQYDFQCYRYKIRTSGISRIGYVVKFVLVEIGYVVPTKVWIL